MTPLSSSNPDYLTCGVRVLTVFPSRPHARVFRAAVDEGADATLSVVGEVLGDFVSSAEEADAKGWSGAKVRPSAHSSLLSAQSGTSTILRFYYSPT